MTQITRIPYPTARINAKRLFWSPNHTEINRNRFCLRQILQKQGENLGFERSEVIGRQGTEFLTEASRQHAERTCLPAFYRTGILKDEELQFVKKNGEVIDVLLSAIAERDAQGAILRTMAVLVDVTERKQAEQALRHYTERLKMLHELDRAILMARSPEAIAQAALHHIRQLVPYLQASVTTFDLVTHQAMVLAVLADGDPKLKAGLHFPLEAKGITEILQQGRVYHVQDTLTSPPPH